MSGQREVAIDLAGSLAAISPFLDGALEDAVEAVRAAAGQSPNDLCASGTAPEPLSLPEESTDAALMAWVAATSSRFEDVIAPSARTKRRADERAEWSTADREAPLAVAREASEKASATMSTKRRADERAERSTADREAPLAVAREASEKASATMSTWPDEVRSAWALLLRTLAAVADVEVNVRGVALAEWRQQVSRRFGGAALAEWAAQLARTPGLGAAVYRVGAGAGSAAPGHRAFLRGLPADPLSTDARTDIPATRPQTPAPPVWAGIRGALFTCRMPGLDGAAADRSLKADVLVRLDGTARGAHMSRFQEILASLDGRCVDGIGAAAVLIAERAFAAHPAEAARCAVTGARPLSGVAPRSLRRSPIWVTESAAACVDAVAATGSIAATVDIATACPGTLAFSRLAAMQTSELATGCGMLPTFTHMQPGKLTVEASGEIGRLPSAEVLLAAIDDCAHVRRTVLKRPDEHDFVERVHRRPQFAEDLCRSAAAAVASRLAGDIRLTATVTLDESIHPHAATATVAGSARQFWCAP
jgi:GTP cyclohydrolase FolE2